MSAKDRAFESWFSTWEAVVRVHALPSEAAASRAILLERSIPRARRNGALLALPSFDLRPQHVAYAFQLRL